MVTKDHLKDVLAGKKQLLKKAEVQHVELTHYQELSVKNLWPQFKKDPDMAVFFPDKFPMGKGPPREYFFNVLNTVHPNYLAQVMLHADKQRMTTEGEAMKKQSINISEYWNEQLKAMPYLSCKYSKSPMRCSAILSILFLLSFLQRRTARPCTC